MFGANEKKPGFFDRLKQAVASTKAQLVERLETITEGKTAIDQGVLDELEATLITADLGVGTTGEILTRLKAQVKAQKLREPRQLRAAVEQEVLTLLENPGCAGGPAGDRRRGPGGPSEPAKPRADKPARGGGPEVIFVVGVNGVGKTTSIAKLAHYYLQQNRRPLLAAQRHEVDLIATATATMREIAHENDSVAQELTVTVSVLASRADEFEREVRRPARAA